MEISNDDMAKMAKALLLAHMCMIVTGFLSGVLECARSFGTTAAWSELETQENGSVDLLDGALSIFIVVGFCVAFPIILFCLAKSAVKNNNNGLMQAVCLIDGCCSCCSGFMVVVWVQSFVSALQTKGWIEELQCRQHSYVTHEGTVAFHSVLSSSEEYDYDECLKARDAAISTCVLYAVLSVFLGLLSGCETIAWVVGLMKSHSAHNALMSRRVFTGVPTAPSYGMTTPVGQMANGTPMNMVVGQPINSGVVMGTPVSPSNGDPKAGSGQT